MIGFDVCSTFPLDLVQDQQAIRRAERERIAKMLEDYTSARRAELKPEFRDMENDRQMHFAQAVALISAMED